MTHLPGPLPQGDSTEGAGESLQGELSGEEGGGPTALRGNHGGMLEGVGPLLQQAHAVRAGLDVRDHGHQEKISLAVSVFGNVVRNMLNILI